MKPEQKKILMGVVLVFIALGLIVLALQQVGLLQFFMDADRLLAFIRRHRTDAAMTFIALQVTQVVVAFLPGEVTGFVGGILFGPARGILYSTIGLTLGSWIAFLLGRCLGRPVITRLIRHETVVHYEDMLFGTKRRFLAFLMFLIPGFPKDILCYLLGLTLMGRIEFLIISTPGRLFGTILLTYEGAYFRQEKYISFFILVGIALGTALLVWIFKGQIEHWMKHP